ncbi:hypothetical protein FACS1894180_6810 [Bacteroidia bacterium]|nr:hypothetical protein FACS1894180_6810 [Bacteroidia bacterium]
MRNVPLYFTKIIIKAGGIVLIIVVGVLLINTLITKNKEVEIHQSVVEKVEAVGKLSLVKMTLQDVVEYTKIREWLPDASALLVVQGEVEAGIDLAKLKDNDIYVSEKEISVYLPAPEITSFKINHEKSRVYDTRNNFFSGAEIVDAAYSKAEKQMHEAALASGILQTAEENATKFFVPFFQSMGFTKINLHFGQTPPNFYKEQ